ncbi:MULTISPECIES: SixA phosphatase family protein [unclassified Carboxylicivirga]|uniref:SixA phosphatase family protein n=1 Tax=Carboxylicivirga TaxID=1628153 RepID=UPI003D338C2C
MRTLILTRHAKTEQLGYNSDKSDFERELKPRGYDDSKLIAQDMTTRGIHPDLLISSTAARATQTMRVFAELLNIEKHHIVREQFLYDGYTTSELLLYLAQYNEKYPCIMIIGHNPEIAMSAITLSNSDYLHFPTTGTIAISFDVESWEQVNAREGKIDWFISPKMFK